MNSTRQELLDLIVDPDRAYDQPAAELQQKQLRAAQHLFKERREQIPLVGRRADDAGIGDGEFHPQTIMKAGGGVKGVSLPPDYKEQVQRFYGNVIRPAGYGMTEMAQGHPRCEAGRYHHAPGLIWLILDPVGERLLTAADGVNGLVEGRFGFLDLLYEGRWGGLISGDKVTVDFAERCPCGRAGPTILDNISRFAQTGEDDHIGCAGTIDGYIRGVLNA